ncbi:MAG: hypothetical protein IJO14_07900 [Clostridia bacterium]|nr:hypothetical protein [Clostridia bacterium]
MTNENNRSSRSDDALHFMVRRLLTLTEHLYTEVISLRKQMQEVSK